METPRPPVTRAAAVAALDFCNPLVWLLRHLYTANPFYVISAGLTLAGLHLIFYDRDAAAHPNAVTLNSWLLLGVLGAYAGVLALTAILIVRLGQVWDDARTILLTVVLLFVAMSVSFDKLVLTSSATFVQLLGVGLLFAIALSEGLLRGLGIRLRALFCEPYYLALGLFFLYPILLMHLLDGVGDGDPKRGMEWTMWGILLFPTAASVVTLSLLPAVWRGPSYVADNGTPWRWPLFPWSLFVFLGVGVVLRAYYFSLSFHAFPGVASPFGGYFLTPFLLSVALVVFELGRSADSRRTQAFAVAAPLAILWLALPDADRSAAYQHFLSLYMARAGSPLVAAWWGLVLFYLCTWLRGFRLAEIGVVAVLVFGSTVRADTVNLRSFHWPAAEPLVVASVWLLVQAVLHPRNSARWLLASANAVGTLTVALWATPFTGIGGAIPIHLLLGVVLMLGLVCRDRFARFLRQFGSVGMMAAGVAALVVARRFDHVPAAFVTAYLASLGLVAWGYWFTLRGWLQLAAAIVVTACWLGHLGWSILSALRRVRESRGAMALLGSAFSFAVGVGISLLKMRFRRAGPERTADAAPPV